MRNIGKNVIALIIPEGAHHLDLRGSDPNDPVSVLQARKIERQHIQKWINEAHLHMKSDIGPDDDNIVG